MNTLKLKVLAQSQSTVEHKELPPFRKVAALFFNTFYEANKQAALPFSVAAMGAGVLGLSAAPALGSVAGIIYGARGISTLLDAQSSSTAKTKAVFYLAGSFGTALPKDAATVVRAGVTGLSVTELTQLIGLCVWDKTLGAEPASFMDRAKQVVDSDLSILAGVAAGTVTIMLMQDTMLPPIAPLPVVQDPKMHSFLLHARRSVGGWNQSIAALAAKSGEVQFETAGLNASGIGLLSSGQTAVGDARFSFSEATAAFSSAIDTGVRVGNFTAMNVSDIFLEKGRQVVLSANESMHGNLTEIFQSVATLLGSAYTEMCVNGTFSNTSDLCQRIAALPAMNEQILGRSRGIVDTAIQEMLTLFDQMAVDAAQEIRSQVGVDGELFSELSGRTAALTAVAEGAVDEMEIALSGFSDSLSTYVASLGAETGQLDNFETILTGVLDTLESRVTSLGDEKAAYISNLREIAGGYCSETELAKTIEENIFNQKDGLAISVTSLVIGFLLTVRVAVIEFRKSRAGSEGYISFGAVLNRAVRDLWPTCCCEIKGSQITCKSFFKAAWDLLAGNKQVKQTAYQTHKETASNKVLGATFSGVNALGAK